MIIKIVLITCYTHAMSDTHKMPEYQMFWHQMKEVIGHFITSFILALTKMATEVLACGSHINKQAYSPL